MPSSEQHEIWTRSTSTAAMISLSKSEYWSPGGTPRIVVRLDCGTSRRQTCKDQGENRALPRTSRAKQIQAISATFSPLAPPSLYILRQVLVGKHGHLGRDVLEVLDVYLVEDVHDWLAGILEYSTMRLKGSYRIRLLNHFRFHAVSPLCPLASHSLLRLKGKTQYLNLYIYITYMYRRSTGI
jgi:hypothetical protein